MADNEIQIVAVKKSPGTKSRGTPLKYPILDIPVSDINAAERPARVFKDTDIYKVSASVNQQKARIGSGEWQCETIAPNTVAVYCSEAPNEQAPKKAKAPRKSKPKADVVAPKSKAVKKAISTRAAKKK